MSASMGPPPPRNPIDAAAPAGELLTSESTKNTDMGPPHPRNPNPSAAESLENHRAEPQLDNPQTDASENSTTHSSSSEDSNTVISSDADDKHEQLNSNAAVPYTIPAWSGPPDYHFFLEVLKDGAIINQFDVNKKGAYMFGRVDLCDFVLEHPTISRFHAVLQYKSNGGSYLYDLGSTHGTSINKCQVKRRVYVDLHVGDVIRFGQSSRLYVFQGPSDLMPPESDLKRLRHAKIRQDTEDMEASLLRAKIEASRADGISWGMREDAIEETEDEVDEITWQTYKGQLTDKQEKTRDKVIKRLEKIAHMKKEIDAIRAKDIAQGGLTQGQQTQIARNEQRISQIMEELENLEETLNESIRESIGARAGRTSRGKKKGTMEDDEEDYMSEDDEFYDRTRKSSKLKTGEHQSVETAETLLDKKDAVTKEIEDKEKLLLDEDKLAEKNEAVDAGDALDAYMSAVSSRLVLDKNEKLHEELSTLRSELNRILYLLRIADPTGEAALKRESKGQQPKATVKDNPTSDASNQPSSRKNQKLVPLSKKPQTLGPEGSLVKSVQEKDIVGATSESEVKREEPKPETHMTGTAVSGHAASKPQWLGAVGEEDREKQSSSQVQVDMHEADEFVDYKDRAAILTPDPSLGDQGIANASPGLIIRKRKEVERPKASEVKDSDETIGSELKAEDAVALLLKHSRGYHALDEEDRPLNEEAPPENQGKRDAKRPKRVLGPERPSFLDGEIDYTSWVPPEGQSGDGRTSLNDRLGY